MNGRSTFLGIPFKEFPRSRCVICDRRKPHQKTTRKLNGNKAKVGRRNGAKGPEWKNKTICKCDYMAQLKR